MPLRFDLNSDNFSYYFLGEVGKMGEAQKSMLPKEILYKIFIKGHRVSSKATYKLSFLTKLFVLIKCLNKRFTVIIEDNERGVNVEDFFEQRKRSVKKSYITEDSGRLLLNGDFVLADTELFNMFYTLNSACASPAYTYLSKVKNKVSLPQNEYLKNMKFVSKWINNYESVRKRIVMESGLTMAEWLTLTYLYDGEEKSGSYLYKEKFRYSYNSSSTKIKVSFGTLQDKGYIVKIGFSMGAKFKITSLGKDKVCAVMEKYVVNC